MDSTQKTYQEKRNFIRMKVETPASVSVSSGDEVLAGICKDLSGGGMLIELPKPLPLDSTVEVEIASSHGHAPILKAKARVTRSEAQPADDQQPCVVGMEIVEVLS